MLRSSKTTYTSCSRLSASHGTSSEEAVETIHLVALDSRDFRLFYSTPRWSLLIRLDRTRWWAIFSVERMASED